MNPGTTQLAAAPVSVAVAIDVPLPGLFDYLVPPDCPVAVGQRVLVAFGPRQVVGLVLEVAYSVPETPFALKPLLSVLGDMPALTPEVLALARFCADYYQHPIGQVLHTLLPGRFREPAPFNVPPAVSYLAADASALLASIPKRAGQQRNLATLLAQPCSEAQVRTVSAGAWKCLQTWLADGLVTVTAAEVAALPPPASGPALNAEQQSVVNALIAAAGFAPFLLYGITGSGKTEVYLQVIADALAQGRQALVLVPEINLTPQLEGRFRQRFAGIDMVSLHSGIADGERAAAWVKAARGEARIVLGTRLAVFTPMPELGLIVVDEEHDASFKQQDGLRYSARDVAVYRAKAREVRIVLGSATPSFESWQNALAGRYTRLTLRERAVSGAQPPRLRLIPTRRQPLVEGLHASTVAAIETRLARHEQVLVFLNRRGYAPVMHCGECGWMAACKRCSARLTVHLRARSLRCHHCGLETRLPPQCPACGNQDMRPLGQGTQRLEDALAGRFPAARVLRLDRDSTRRKGSFKAALQRIHDGEADILVGTQMLAKGHDFPNLTLVVVVGADSGLYAADFRAGERLFAQLSQVAGRAGRADKPGEVLIQTDFPEHPLYAALAQQDFAAFAELELAERRLAGFPPWCSQALLRAEATQLADALAFLGEAAALVPADDEVLVFDPVPATMVRLANRERGQLLLQSASRGKLQRVLREWMTALRKVRASKVRWSLDVDPLDI